MEPTAEKSCEARAKRRPTVFIASPYTKGDLAINTHFQCQVFDRLLNEKRCWPVAPLWTHFQHLLFPRPYHDWIEYDQALLRCYDCCLRLTASFDAMGYEQADSTGADAEVEAFRRLNRPVFFSIDDLYQWIDRLNEDE
jgi:hypothetical protein